MTVLDALRDPALFAPLFGPTWRPWCALLAGLFGLPMDAPAAAIFRKHTGRSALPTEPAAEGWVIAGRRSGKSRIAALVAVFLAAFRDYSALLAPGERGVVMLIASDKRQCRVLLGYIRALLHQVPMLSRLVESETREATHLANGISLEVHTASFRSTRGYTIVGAVLDETAFWRSEDAAEPDHEVVNALRPGMATMPGALLLGISSPYAQRGVLYHAFRDHFGKDGDPVLVWRASSREMNPTLAASVVERAYAEDPNAAAAEYGGHFRSDVEAFLSREVVEGCIAPGCHELPPVEGAGYVAFVDPSGGSRDSMTLAVAHHEAGSEPPRVVLDALRERRPPFSPDAVVEDFAKVLRSYGLARVTGDRYGGAWPAERFTAHRIDYQFAEKVKSDLYGELLPLVNAGRAELLDVPRLVAQLCALERRTSRSGRESIDHPPSGRDDVANAAAGALVLAAERAKAASLTNLDFQTLALRRLSPWRDERVW